MRFRDAPADLRDSIFAAREQQLPPAFLRYRVSGTSDRKIFQSVGADVARDVVRAASPFLRKVDTTAVLDFGVGCGRIARHMPKLLEEVEMTGVDVEPRAIRWCNRHLSGRYIAIDPESPLPFREESFDFVYAVSVFTHLDAPAQRFWLSGLARVLHRDGCLLVTTLSPELAYSRPDMSPEQRQQLAGSGFVYLPGHGPFNENSAFQSRDSLSAVLPRLALVHHETYGLAKYQDIAVFRSGLRGEHERGRTNQ